MMVGRTPQKLPLTCSDMPEYAGIVTLIGSATCLKALLSTANIADDAAQQKRGTRKPLWSM
ncbi:MAG: hypothetical protein ABI395_06260 [Sphingobium sp.]